MSFTIHKKLVLALAFTFLCTIQAPGQTDVPTGSKLYFPHLANGDQGNGYWKTNFVFINNSSSQAQGKLYFYGDNGQSLSFKTSQGSGDTFTITIPAYARYEIETDGSGSVVTGYAEAYFDHAVVGSAVFSFSTGLGKVVSVGVLPVLPKTAFYTPAEARTGIAITNHYNLTQNLELGAFDQSGNPVATQTLTLAPFQHIARTAKNLFPQISSDFVGSVKVYSTNGWISALAIGFISNLSFDVGYAVAAIAYDAIPTTLSGTYTNWNGTGSGTFKASNLEHSDPNMFTGTLEMHNQTANLTYQGPVLGNVDSYGLVYTLYFNLSGMKGPGVAVAELQSDGSLAGFIADDGSGNYGDFSVSGTSSTYTLRSGSSYTISQGQQATSRLDTRLERLSRQSDGAP